MTRITNPNSLGFKLGKAIGWSGAQVVQRSAQLAESTGDFGHNVVAGSKAQYADTTQSIAAARAAHYAKLAGIELAPRAETSAAPAPRAKATAKA